MATMDNKDKNLIVIEQKPAGLWLRTRKLLLLQVKLWIDAIRDFALMPVALICYLLDLVSDDNKTSYWQRLMKWGRQSDHHINLFQHDTFEKKKTVTVDDIADIVEDVLTSKGKGSKDKNRANTQQLVEAVKQRVKTRFNQGQK